MLRRCWKTNDDLSKNEKTISARVGNHFVSPVCTVSVQDEKDYSFYARLSYDYSGFSLHD